ncbi:MAG: DUF5724 domain-containing protein, partial [Planctomycetaceae bacterium]|nr:DUF5724 domain-containing protein [Planctomycetaceae bacterium]
MTLEEKFEARVNELKNAIPKLKKENQEIAEQFVHTLSKVDVRNKKFEYLLFNGKTQLAEIFSGNRAELIPFFFGKENASRFEKLWDRLPISNYQIDWQRRSFHTKVRTVLYFEKGVKLIRAFFNSTLIGFNLEQYLNTYIKSPNKNYFDTQDKSVLGASIWQQITTYSLIQNLIALAIDENDEFVMNRIKEIIYDDNNAGILTIEILRGILISRNPNAHKFVGDLLLAAKLQEGLRQTIVEACDECSIEGFHYIIKIILDNNLERFSSIVRAIGTWMGLQTAEFRPKTIRKILEIAADIISNKANIDQLLDSDDSVEIYVALWGIGLREITDTQKPLLNLVKSKKKYKQLAALHFLRQADDHQLMKDVVFEMLDENDLELWVQLAAMLDLVLTNEWQSRRIEILQNKINNQEENSGEDDEIDLDSYCRYSIVRFRQCRTNDNEIRNFFVRLNQLAESTPKKVTRFEPDAFNADIRYISANTFIRPMVSCVVLLGGNDADVRLLLSLILKMDARIKVQLVLSILTLDNPLHRKALIDLFCDQHLGHFRDTINKVFKNVILLPKEFETIENALRFKDAKIRVDIINLMLQQPPENLQKSIERLLNSKEEQKRLAGLDLIDQTEKLSKSKKEYAKVVSACKQITLNLAENEKEKGTKKSAAEEILIQKFTEKKKPEYTKENGFGLCNPNGKLKIPEPKKSKELLANIFISEMPRLEKILIVLDNLIHEYRDYEYTGYFHYSNETTETKILGSSQSLLLVKPYDELKKKYGKYFTAKFEEYVLADVWLKFYKEQKLTVKDIVLLAILIECAANFHCSEFEDFCNGKGQYEKYASDFTGWFRTVCWNHEKMKPYCDNLRGTKYCYLKLITNLIHLFYEDIPIEEKSDFIVDILSGIYSETPKNLFTQPCSSHSTRAYILGKLIEGYKLTLFDAPIPPIKKPLDFCRTTSADSARFEERFNILYKFYEASNYNHVIAPSIDILEKARALNLIDDEELLREILIRENCLSIFKSVAQLASYGIRIRHIFIPKKDESLKYPHFVKVLSKVIDRILEIELPRGDSPTEVSSLAIMIQRFEGIRYFVQIL